MMRCSLELWIWIILLLGLTLTGLTGCSGDGPQVCTTSEDCNDNNECTEDTCDVTTGNCDHAPVADETQCRVGVCQAGQCEPIASVFPCTEEGIREAIGEGGGPHAFSCNGPTTVVTQEEIVIENDVILNGLDNLTIDGNDDHRVFSVSSEVTVELFRMSITGGHGDDGGGIRNNGRLWLTSSSVSGNTADYNGGGIYNDWASESILVDSTVSGNSAGNGAGIMNYRTLTLSGSSVSGNTAMWDGGGIWSSSDTQVALIDSMVSGNTSEWAGGGVHSGGRLMVTNSSVSGNTAVGGGGGIHCIDLTMTNSTVSGNTTDASGGGITHWGTSTVTNSTVSGNVAAETGGGILNWWNLTLINTTLSGNTAATGGNIGGGNNVMLSNTLIDGDCELENGYEPVTLGGNLESPGDTCGLDPSIDEINVTPAELNLGALQDNGGPTLTHLPGPESAAIDIIDPEDCVDADGLRLTKDQRGEMRPQGRKCDVGAVEVVSGAP